MNHKQIIRLSEGVMGICAEYMEVDDDSDTISYSTTKTQDGIISAKIIDMVGENCAPDDVFTDDQLSDWALANGFQKIP